MNYLISLNSDAGLCLEENQDSCLALTSYYNGLRLAFAIVCDGMGGLSSGEVASKVTVDAFKIWINEFLSEEKEIAWNAIQESWLNIIDITNQNLGKYGSERALKLGTTLTAVLFIGNEYLAVNVGDSRLYRVTDKVTRITNDHTLVAFKVRQGKMTEEEAENAPDRNVLLQCVGASDEVFPDYFFGKVSSNEVYFLCSDGFRHKIADEEFLTYFSPEKLKSKEDMDNSSEFLIELNKERNEKDNISVVIVKSTD